MAQQMTLSTNYWRLSFSLWIDYVQLVYSRAINIRAPFKVDESEIIGRALFSGHCKKGRILASAFMPKSFSRELSTNRLSCVQNELFETLSSLDAINRSKKSGNHINFYGFAVLEVKKLRGIQLDAKNSLDVRSSPSLKNPLHADIVLPPYEGKDYDLLIADELIEISKFQPVSE